MPRAAPLLLAVLGLLASITCRSALGTAPLEILDVGRYNFTGGAGDRARDVAEELSGLSRVDGDRYVAVSDEHATLYFLRISVDPVSGRVQSVVFEPPIALRDADGGILPEPRMGSDREGVAYDPASGSVWVADEWDSGDPSRPSLVEFDLATGRRLSIVVPSGDGPFSVFSAVRKNYGLESMTRSETDGVLWTANEEALAIDGPLAGPGVGSIVRLQALDASRRAGLQVAYVTDPVDHAIASPSPAVGQERSGVCELVALPDGRLLVLERALGGTASGMAEFRIRVYVAEPGRATDLSDSRFRSGLAGRADYVPTPKELLFERRFGLPVANFEAMALGPRLENGDRSLLLVADNGGGTWQSIYALRLRGVP